MHGIYCWHVLRACELVNSHIYTHLHEFTWIIHTFVPQYHISYFLWISEFTIGLEFTLSREFPPNLQICEFTHLHWIMQIAHLPTLVPKGCEGCGVARLRGCCGWTGRPGVRFSPLDGRSRQPMGLHHRTTLRTLLQLKWQCCGAAKACAVPKGCGGCGVARVAGLLRMNWPSKGENLTSGRPV